VAGGHEECVRVLLEHGAYLDVTAQAKQHRP